MSTERYDIYRFRFDGPTTVVKRNVTLEEAQAHCLDDSTKGEGWFDGYDVAGTHR